MEHLWIALPVLAVALFVVVIVLRSRRADKPNTSNHTSNDTLFPVKFEQNGIVIPIEQLPAATQLEENRLFEIKDSTIVARISQTFPAAAQIVAKTIANNALKNVELFKMDIPSAALVKSKEVEGAFRAFSRSKKEITKNANLVRVDPTKMSNASSVANGVANVMNIGSMVVGQYYMAEINSKLEEMSKSIDKISDFQNRGFKSRIFALIPRVREISVFSSEIIDNNDFRNRKLQTLDDLKGECTKLLQQVNLTVDEEIKKHQKIKYEEYQSIVDDFTVLCEQQQILLSVLEEISQLTYLLGKGESSHEMCYSIFNTYLEQTEQIRMNLQTWHDKQAESLAIDIDKNRKSKTGVEGFFATIPGIFDDKWKFKELKNGLGQKIAAQKATKQMMFDKHEEIYEKDVQIVIKDGKYFYLTGELYEHN